MNIGIIVAIVIVAALGVGAYFLFVKKGSSVQGGSAAVIPTATGWTFQYSLNMPAQMSRASDGTFFFDFPSQDGVHYVIQKAPPLAFGQTMTINFNLSGTGTLLVSDSNDTVPATLRLYIQGQGVNDRWWGHPAVNLTDGDHTLAILIDATLWTGVGGGVSQPPLTSIIGSIANVGFTFGGQSFAGHGVYASGAKRFTLKSFIIA